MKPLVKINFHGKLGEKLGGCWELSVSSVSQAISAINTLTDGELFKFLGRDGGKAKYKVLINEEEFISEQPLDEVSDIETNIKKVSNSNLMINYDDLKSVDILPVLDFANSGVLGIIAGVLLVIGGIIVMGASFGGASVIGVAMIMGGIGLIAAGVAALLARPPKFEDFRESDAGKVSYLFNGPENTTREGGPVQIGYGRLLVGSQVVGGSYLTRDIDSESADEKEALRDRFRESCQRRFEGWQYTQHGLDAIELCIDQQLQG